MKSLCFLSGLIGLLNGQITWKLLGVWVAWAGTSEIRMSVLGRPLFPSKPFFHSSHCRDTAAGTPGCCWRISAFPHLFQTTPLFFFRSHQIQLSESLLVLFASSGKWGQEALQTSPNRFRKPKVLLHIPVIINSEDQSKTTKMEPEKIVVLQNLGVKALTSARDLLSTGLNGCCFAPFFKAVLSFGWLCTSESSVWPQRAISTKSDVMNNF